MILHAEGRQLPMSEALHRVVVQMTVGDLAVDGLQRCLIDAKPVILAGDFDPARLQIPDGLIGAPMTEGQLPGGRTQRQAEQLMPQTDANGGHLAGDGPKRLSKPRRGSRVAGAVGHKEAVGLGRPNLLHTDRGRNQMDLAPS